MSHLELLVCFFLKKTQFLMAKQATQRPAMTKTGTINVKHIIWAFSEFFFSFLILLVNAYICLCTYRIINFNCIIYLNICLIVLSSLNSLNACTKFLCLLHLQFTMLNLLKHMLNPLIILNCSYLLNTLSILRKNIHLIRLFSLI